jgi:hypothetical protein
MKSENAKTPEPLSAPLRILKVGSCPSLTGRSTIGYRIEMNDASELFVKLVSNSGGGYFNSDAISLSVVQKLLATVAEGNAVTSTTLAPLFLQRSANSAGFLWAALMHMGLIRPAKEKRTYELTTDAAAQFFMEIKGLIDSGISLAADDKAIKIPRKAAMDKAKTIQVDNKSEVIAPVPVQQVELMSKQPWPIKKSTSKVILKKV